AVLGTLMYMRPCVSTRRLGSKPQPFSTVTGRPKLGGAVAAWARLPASAEPATHTPAATSSSARRSAPELRDPAGVTFLSSPLAAKSSHRTTAAARASLRLTLARPLPDPRPTKAGSR